MDGGYLFYHWFWRLYEEVVFCFGLSFGFFWVFVL